MTRVDGGGYRSAGVSRLIGRRLRQLTEQMQREFAELRGAINRLYGELRARPYTARPDLFRTTDEEGREQIGFRNVDGPERTGYLGFEDVFRGSEALVRERQAMYVDHVRDHEPVVDIGCGRGEFLDLLRDAGVRAEGIDVEPAMVELTTSKGHNVVLGDGLAELERRDDHSVGAIFAAQVIEHLSAADLNRFFELAPKKLKPGGVLIAETVNPHSIQAMQAFWVDPTHVRPVFPDVAVALCWLSGFAEATIVFPLGSGDVERDLYDTGEFAVVARTHG